jgi:hypothetical protein
MSGCATVEPPPKDPPIKIGAFECPDPLLAKFVRRILAERMRKWTTADISFDGEGEIEIRGMIYMQDISTAAGGGFGMMSSGVTGVSGAAGHQSRAISATVVTGISVSIIAGGAEMDSYTWLQKLDHGIVLDPGAMSRRLAEETYRLMRKHKLVDSSSNYRQVITGRKSGRRIGPKRPGSAGR